ncbi:hypothetical protein CCY99_02430 [Helicobacter sp. 16-1353]|uniref:type I restriction endonuclease subunit R n=1 Tax=Helicobacter sp. 16-1353 TaxID=2004996 RepID=UPI000DCD35E5|nr:type I restriction endonuclease subunit R [Helicobacter sp. 16-1353]RAX54639.1 hypothetical protein CCY99_02430 [Helicobacter sp. 16-1353]
MTPEQSTRIKIDEMLQNAGFVVQDRAEFNRTASLGVAVREFAMRDGSFADYILFIDGKACGVIEAKKEGISLGGAEIQASNYARNLPKDTKSWAEHFNINSDLVFAYESNGNELRFRDFRDINVPSRNLFSFHKPEFLKEILLETSTLRNRLKPIPPISQSPLNANLRACQSEAILGLENSLQSSRPRSLIQMATGAGKTYTACNFTYRLLKFAKAKRILFLVDRNNLGRQTKKEFDNFILADSANRKFSEVYTTSHLVSNAIDKDAKVIITTIQRLYSMLCGESEFEAINEEKSSYENANKEPKKEVKYNPQIPIETFDFIIVDECHRSIYGEWRAVLEYFDAFIIGLSATPSTHTLGFFNKNIVAEYPLERSIIDGVNVDCEIYRIKTKIGEQGGILEAGKIPVRDKRTKKLIYETLEDDIEYSKSDLDRSVVAKNQIRAVIEAYKNALFTQLFPERKNHKEGEWIPKTLIFAKDDAHADEIVNATREVFSKSDEFAQKITYNIGNAKPEMRINAFRTDPKFRIAVTVDMIATGTDIKSLEVLIFMRDVKSKSYYFQMKGRGVRTIDSTSLREVTPNAISKEKFYIIDAVGVSERQWKDNDSRPLDTKKSISLKKLLEIIAKGNPDDDTLITTARRITQIERKADKEDLKEILELTNDKTLRTIANELLNLTDPDFIESCKESGVESSVESGESAESNAESQAESNPESATESAESATHSTPESNAIFEAIKEQILSPFNNPTFRQKLIDLAKKCKMYIDWTPDEVISTGNVPNPEDSEVIADFENYIEKHKDEITALSIIYNNSYKNRFLTYELIDELYKKLLDSNPLFDIKSLWKAYAATCGDKVKPLKSKERLTNLIQLVRFAIDIDTELSDFESVGITRFNLWRGREIKKGVVFTAEQDAFLLKIRDYILSNACIKKVDLQDCADDLGGIYKAKMLFGERLDSIILDLNTTLVA